MNIAFLGLGGPRGHGLADQKQGQALPFGVQHGPHSLTTAIQRDGRASWRARG
jgi:hypothetical protein